MQLAVDHARLADFARAATTLLGLMPVLYGVLTWIFGDRIWGGNPVYGTAMQLPGAPQTWGAAFFILGMGTLISARTGHDRLIIWFTAPTAVVFASFMVTFLVEAVRHNNPSALAPATVYAVLSLLLMARARMAWQAQPRRCRRG
jgi:hypothetical protein